MPKADIELIEMTTRILCICGTPFYQSSWESVHTCFNCERRYKIVATFRRFEAVEITQEAKGD